MLAYTEGNVKVDGIKIHYYRTGGNKPPFVLLHGATDNGLCWIPVTELLADEYDVVMPDAQGHGLSDRLDKNFNYLNHAIQTIALINELGLKKPFIMGHSMGAGTAVNTAVNYPDLPKAVILEDPGWRSPESDDPAESRKQHEAFAEMALGYRNRTREELVAQCRKDNPLWSEAEIGPWADSKLQFDPLLFSLLQIDRPSYEELVPKIVCPTLLITSDGGLVTPEIAEHARQLWKSDKPLRWVSIKGAGHNIRREQFRTFCNTLFGFLMNCKD